jgi:hypothetical protein
MKSCCSTQNQEALAIAHDSQQIARILLEEPKGELLDMSIEIGIKTLTLDGFNYSLLFSNLNIKLFWYQAKYLNIRYQIGLVFDTIVDTNVDTN